MTPEQPDEPSEPAARLRLGETLDCNGNPAEPLSLATTSLRYRHVFVCGATGSGKSQTVRALLEAASGAGLPWLVIGREGRGTGR